MSLKACHCCGLVQELPTLGQGERALCARCGTTVHTTRVHASGPRVAATALAALLLYPLAVGLPIMRLERFGHAHEASVWTGSVGLLTKGEWFVGLVVLLCSVVLPLIKLLGLFALTAGRGVLSKRNAAMTYRAIEWAGRWGMLDVLLIAMLVAWIKVGDLVEVQPGPATLAFTCVVLLSLLASAWFDPHAVWEGDASS